MIGGGPIGGALEWPPFALGARVWHAGAVFDRTAPAAAVFDKTAVFIIETEPGE